MAKSSNSSPSVLYALFTIIGVIVGAIATFLFLQANGGGKDPVVAKYQGKSVRASEVFANIKSRLFDLEEEAYRTKEQAINDFIEQRLLEAESKKQNLNIDQIVDKELGTGTGDISDKDIEAFLGSKGLSLKDKRIRKEDVREYLKYRQRFDRRQQYVSKLKQTANVQILVQEPESPKLSVKLDGYPSWGNAKAPVTIVEFSDFQCPFCSRAVPTLDKIKKEYGPDKVRIIFRDMPLPSHGRAVPAALASHCANEQGKFWEMHDTLFQNQTALEDKDLKVYGKKIGLNESQYESCLESKKHQSTVDASKAEAEKLGISATPSFVINGTLMQGAQPFERFKEKIDRASKKG